MAPVPARSGCADTCQRATIQTGRVVDWMIEYGVEPAIWICTAKAW